MIVFTDFPSLSTGVFDGWWRESLFENLSQLQQLRTDENAGLVSIWKAAKMISITAHRDPWILHGLPLEFPTWAGLSHVFNGRVLFCSQCLTNNYRLPTPFPKENPPAPTPHGLFLLHPPKRRSFPWSPHQTLSIPLRNWEEMHELPIVVPRWGQGHGRRIQAVGPAECNVFLLSFAFQHFPIAAHPGIVGRQGHRKHRQTQSSCGTRNACHARRWTNICDSCLRCTPKVWKYLFQRKQC